MSEVKILPVVGFEGYYSITDNGDVWSHINNRWMSRTVDNYGYEVVTLRDCRTHRIHLLVLTAFVGPRPEGLQGLHKDDVKSNNHLSNLEWGTHEKNMAQRSSNGNTAAGERNRHAKLTEEHILLIRHRYADGESVYEMAEEFGVEPNTMYDIIKGRTWKHSKGPIASRGRRCKIVEDEVREIRRAREAGESAVSLMIKYSISDTAIHNIVKRKTWSHVQ